ncbi:COP9 signalosome (CSN) subunit [Globomyces sp. JEL0801]|nr:COP9 signalosome (CSN) subunit [Globomyces sp. JEL0801]
MKNPLDDYLQQALNNINDENGWDLSCLLSYSKSSSKYLNKFILKVQNLKDYLSYHIPEPWNEIIYLHLNILLINDKDHSALSRAQNTLTQNFHAIFQNLSRWVLPVLYTLNHDLCNLSELSDKQLKSNGENPTYLEEATRTLNKAFSLCVNDRFSGIEESRKWGVYKIANLLFRASFKLSQINLCTTILKLIASADLPALEQYPKSDQVTFKYYTGVWSFYNENFVKACDDLILTLRYLIPIQILRKMYKTLKVYADIVESIKQGHLFLFDQSFGKHQNTLIKWGTFLTLERARLLVVRQLFRNMWMMSDRPSRMTVQMLATGVRLSMHQTLSDPDQVCCLIVNCIDRGYLKGYLSHEKQTLVLKKGDPFPPISGLSV